MPEVIHVFSEQDSKSSLLAEVHRLQSSLAAMRQARDFHGANSAERMRQVDRLQKEIEMSDGINDGYRRDVRNAQLAAAWGQVNAESAHGPCSVCSDGGQEFCNRHGAKQEAPAPVDAGLVERMCDAFTFGSHRIGYDERAMAAALRVAADGLLGPVTMDECCDDNNAMKYQCPINIFVEARRARLLGPAKTPEERVRIEQRSVGDGSWEVWEDENYCGNHSERNAKALRLGLIATLKQEPRP